MRELGEGGKVVGGGGAVGPTVSQHLLPVSNQVPEEGGGERDKRGEGRGDGRKEGRGRRALERERRERGEGRGGE